MKAVIKPITLVIVSVLLITGCSRKKNTFLSRNFHAVTAEYNILYNGYNALNEGVEALNENYNDDYWDILPVERLDVSEGIRLSNDIQNPNFEIAEEKAVKAIQTHSVNVQGREHNPQMDEAYLLLGKARYYDQRFVPALDAFNNILNKYPTSDKINQVKIWRAKTNIRLENSEQGIKILKRLIKEEELKDQDKADATAMLAQAYLNTQAIDSALTQIKVAAAYTKKNEEKGRYNFITGQLYNKLGYKDSANLAFDKVIDLHRKTPRVYYISAHLEKIKNSGSENGNNPEYIQYLEDLEEDRENRPYLDRIYHQIGEYYNEGNSDSLAVAYYNKSLKANSNNKKLTGYNYQKIGDIYFDRSEYKLAGNYYDSTMQNLQEKTKDFRIIKRKRDNLQDVIYYEDVAKRDDSILRIVSLPETDRLAVYQELVNRLKAQDEAKKLAEEKAQKNINVGLKTADNLNMPSIGGFGNKNQSNTFYFYSPTTIAYGKNEFQKIWGDREYKDNWRWSNTGIKQTGQQTLADNSLENLPDEQKYNPEYYLSQLPSEPKQIDSIAKERNFAYYQLGVIYKNQFKEYKLSKTKLKTLLDNNPEERLVLPAKYNLYKIYQELGENSEAEIVKNEITSTYPDSHYAFILNNPDQQLEKDKNTPENIYENLLQLHEKQKFDEVITKSDDAIKQLEGNVIVPKFEFLKATASGRLYGFDVYKKGINYIALNYPNTLEGKQAGKIIQEVLPKISDTTFVDDANSKSFKVVYSFQNPTEKELNEFSEKLKNAMVGIRRYNLNTSIDVYDKNTTFVVVHGLDDMESAKAIEEILDYKKHKINKQEHFAISTNNYQIIQIHKNLETYLNLNKI